MSWDALRHLSPLSEHPSASPSLSPTLSDTAIRHLEASVRLDSFREAHCSAWRILSSFYEFLDGAGKANLCSDIVQSRDDDQLVFLANHLLDALLKPFALAGGRSPSPLSTPPSEDASVAINVAMSMIDSSTRAAQTRLRNDCFRRDGYRCVYSGDWDYSSVTDDIAVPEQGGGLCQVECAHIIPFSLGVFDESDAVQTRNKAIIWFAIHRYFPQLQDKIDARSINQAANAISLEKSIHGHFGVYNIAFSHVHDVQRPNLYDIVKIGDDRVRLIPSKSGSSRVEFLQAVDDIPMPDTDYLTVHQVIGRILQVSGFGRRISMAMNESSRALGCRGLHTDGSTNVDGLLSDLLLMNVRAGPEDQSNQGDGEPKN